MTMSNDVHPDLYSTGKRLRDWFHVSPAQVVWRNQGGKSLRVGLGLVTSWGHEHRLAKVAVI